MNKNRAWIFIALGLLFAIGTGLLIFYTLQQQSAVALQEARAAVEGEAATVATLRLPVAARQLEIGSQITPNDYLLKDFPLDLVPITAISSTLELENKTLITTVPQGSTFHTSQFLGAKTAVVSQQIAEGFVVLAFPVADLLSQSDIIEDGDAIDLLLTLDIPATDSEAAPAKSTLITVQNIMVLQVVRETPQQEETRSTPTALLLRVTPADAVMIKFVKDSGGVIDFTLRSTVDQNTYQVSPITLEEFSQRYNIR
jgi:pilus assembly protein CpaB